MRVLHLIPRAQRRGAEIFALELIASLAQKGIQGKLFTLFREEGQLGTPNVVQASCLGSNGGSSLGILLALREEIRSYEPHIVLAHGGQPFKFAILSTLFWRKSPPVMYRKIGLSEQWLDKLRFLRIPCYRWLFRKADMIVAVGQSVKQELKVLFKVNTDRIKVIPNAIDPKRFYLMQGTRERLRQELGIRPDAPVLISVGSLSWEKNQEAVIRMLKELKRDHPKTVLILVGDGLRGEDLKKLSKEMNLEDSVRFLGTRSDVPELLVAADIFVLTSLTEGMPGALIEAGFAGLPSVVWDVADVKEVVQHGVTGLVSSYLDDKTFIKALHELITNPEKGRIMGKAAQISCKERFDIGKCAEEYEQLFDKLI